MIGFAGALVLAAGPGAGDPSAGRVRELLDAGRYADAESAARRLLSAAELSTGPDSLDAARALDLLAESFWRGWRGKDPEARPMAERALRIRERLEGHDHPDVAGTLGNLGMILRQASVYPEARAVLERALAIRERHFGLEHLEVAGALNDLATVLQDTGDLGGARSLLDRALRIRQKLLPPDDPRLGLSFNSLGVVLRNSGDYPGAIAAHQKALEIREKSLPPGHPDTSVTLGQLAELLHLTGDYAGARSLYERTLDIRRKAFGEINPRVAEAMGNLASLLRDTGDFAEARQLYEQALKMWETTLGPDHPFCAHASTGLGELLHSMGEDDEAERLFRRALGILEKTMGPEHPLVALDLEDLADLLRERGDRAAAGPCYARALAIWEQGPAPNEPEIARCLSGLGHLRRDEGNNPESRAFYERALRTRIRTVGATHPQVAENLDDLARLDWMTGETAGALERSLQAESLLRDHIRRTARTLSEREALLYERIRSSGLDVALSVVADRGRHGEAPPDAAELVWEQVVRSRALVLDEMAARHRAVFDLESPEMAHLLKDLDASRTRFTRLVVRGRPGEDPERYRAQVEEVRSAMEQAERDLAGRSALFRRREARGRIGVAEISKALPAGGALISYVRYGHLTPGAAVPGPVASYLAFILRAGETRVIAVPLGAADEIESRVQRWREAVRSPAGGARALERYREAAARLREAFWDPVAREVPAARELFIVPDGSLHLVNLATLPAPGDRYLIETGPLLHHLSAERDLIGDEGRPTGRGLLVLGGPDFGAEPGGMVMSSPSLDSCSMTFEPLPSSRLEADEVESLWMKTDQSVLKLTGAQASEAAFKREAPGRRVLHLATHGFFLKEACGPATTAASRSSARGSASDNPLLLSGLALAGANRRGRPAAAEGRDADDGILTAEEIASLDLRGVEWAVLSACETGVGPVQAGEGVLGLRRAFEVAGAGTLILSLWPVTDNDARGWIRQLYLGRLKGLSTADAIRTAGLRILDTRRKAGTTTHPFYWGAFVAAGDWR